MSGSLIKIGSSSTTSGTTFTRTGVSSTYDVHMLVYSNLVPSSDDRLGIRVTKGGSIQDDAKYDNARTGWSSTGANQSNEDQDDTKWLLATAESTGDGAFGTLFLFNFSDSSEFSFVTLDCTMYASTPASFSEVGAGAHLVASASDGISFFWESGSTFSSGNIDLYGIKN